MISVCLLIIATRNPTKCAAISNPRADFKSALRFQIRRQFCTRLEGRGLSYRALLVAFSPHLLFDSWDHLMRFMLKGLGAKIPDSGWGD